LSHQPERQIDHSDSLAFTDVILPCQFFGAMGGSGLCAEQRLMLAVLVDAINILQGWNRMGSARKRRAFAEAGQWVTAHGRNYPFSFDSVCDALGIDPEMLRERLASLVMGFGMQNPLVGGGRLRLKESSRAQHMTANRVRRRKPPRLAVANS
jgi:hypothetical protein